MKKEVKFKDGRVYATGISKPKKITGTRFGAVLESNKWQTPFQAWCEITKVWAKPFEDTKYTLAGKVIEDKQLTWFSRYLPVVRPEDVYGKDFFKKTYGDFFKEDPIFGGMWDSLVGTREQYEAVIECKTTKRSEDWEDDVPEYYALQASLYAYLLGLDDVYMIVTFLEDSDYDNPEKFVCDAENTTYVHFKVSDRYPEFESYIEFCKDWWAGCVESGESPLYDEKKDKEYLDGIRTIAVDDNTDVQALVAEAEKLYDKLEKAYAALEEDEKRLKAVEELIKKYAIEQDAENEQGKCIFKGSKYTWTVSKSARKSVDSDRLKEDGLYEKYLVTKETYSITKSKNKDGEEK